MSTKNAPQHELTEADLSAVPSGASSSTNREDADPEAVLRRIRALVTDHLFAARRLASEAAERFPQHSGIRNAHRILNGGKATVSSSGPEPARDEEIEWLRNPPESVRGRWVGLLGRKLVGTADTLAELIELLRMQNLETRALVHHIA